MDPDPLPAIIYFIVAIVLFGIVVAAEISLAAVNRGDIRQLGSSGSESRQKRRALTIDRLLGHAPRLLTTMMLVRYLSMLVATGAFVYFLIPVVNSTTLVICITILWLFFVAFRVTARTLATNNAMFIALQAAPLVSSFVYLLRPIASLLYSIEQKLSNSPEDATKESIFLTEDGLRLLIDVGDEEEQIEESEKQMIAGILDLDDTNVKEVMVPRIDMVAMRHDTTLTDALDLIIGAGHSRIPVYEDSVDQIIGVLYAKDLLPFFRNAQRNIAIRDVIRPAYFVPATKKVDELFREMQLQHVHMALIVDEYGGTSGLVTIEDLLEEIVGEIQDEYDADAKTLVQRVATDSYLLNSRLSIDEVEKLLNIDAGDIDVDTLGGLIYTISEHVPEPGEIVNFGKWHFTVLEVDGHRIQEVRAEPASAARMEVDENVIESMTIPTRESMVNT